jgi:hypothetical protein
VRSDAETLLALTTAPLLAGLPDVRSPEGRAVLGRLLGRRLVVRGLVRHPVRLTRLTALLSVADGAGR